MNRCNGLHGDCYRGTHFFELQHVICGYADRARDSRFCPKKQTKGGEW